ncbi:hypothetical protein [Pedobacter nutrimenti]|jgi:hypothetical protein|uniref:Uncharacterized protein n=1 Tax=Pedobacter nutrimenti TaxID=1241337 RepID=A0A318UN46_9SPHI|nr:hypothetical protein [Pedobacter nutrimenti]PYF77181.1 hypothetical protein B0O44_101661 [Pedobacter nutrimenti]
MNEELSYTLNRFGSMLHFIGGQQGSLIEETEPEIESAYKALTDLIFQGILEDEKKSLKVHTIIKRDLLRLLEEANEVMTFFKFTNPERYFIADIIFCKLQMIFDFLDDFEGVPSTETL